MQCPKISRNVLHHDVNQSVATLMRKRTNQSSYSITYEAPIGEYLKSGAAVERSQIDMLIRDPLGITYFFDFRFCIINPSATPAESSVQAAEREKIHYYDTNYDFPVGTFLIPAAIDSRGRFGPLLHDFLAQFAHQYPGQYSIEFNYLKTMIAAAHVNAVERNADKFLKKQITPTK